MEYLLKEKNLPLLKSFCLANTLFAFDYDGTLAPLTNNPDRAFMREETSQLLKELSGICPIAIITGRSVADVEKFLPIKPDHIIGNHGSEGTQSPADLFIMSGLCQEWLKTMESFAPILDKLGITVENKTYSLTLHYRKSMEAEIAEATIASILSRLPKCRVSPGKAVINIVPEMSLNKGEALDMILRTSGHRFCIYFGDDQTDEDVFHRNSSRLMTVKVGPGTTSAKYYLRQQVEIDIILSYISQFTRV